VTKTLGSVTGSDTPTGKLLAPATSIVNKVANHTSHGPLAPVTNLVSNLTNNITKPVDSTAPVSVLKPVVTTLKTVTTTVLAIPAGDTPAGKPLAPVTNLVGNLTSGVTGSLPAPVTNTGGAATQGKVLKPVVTTLKTVIGGVLGKRN